jgi:hypothetical protein
MPALPTVVSDYINSVKNSLSTGSDLGSNMRGAAKNYLRAQDMAQVLELLQTYGFNTGTLAATGGTVRTVVDTAIFVAGSQVGNTVVFSGNVTTELTGITRLIDSNSTTTLTIYGDDLPAAPVATDTYTIVGTMFTEAIAALRQGKGVADSPPGNVYGSHVTAVGALLKGIYALGGTPFESNIGRSGLQTTAGSTTTVINLTTFGVPFTIDQLRGYRVTISGESSIVLKNDESSVTLRAPLSTAPSAATAVAITVPVNDFGSTSAPNILVHPGRQPGENILLSSRINQLQGLIVALTLPT